MYDNQAFAKMVTDGKPTGEVVGMNNLLIRIHGLEGAAVNSLILFENGDRALVRSVQDQEVEVMALAAGSLRLGMVAVLEQLVYQVGVGEPLVGRIVNVLGQPLDGKGAVAVSQYADVFAPAPGVVEREMLNEQLVTGVTIVDSLFPFVLGQRLAILGDSKSGKSTFMRQLTTQQVAAGHIVVYVLIAKRQTDIDTLIASLQASGAIAQTIVVVASSSEALSLAYLSPYVACAMAEYLWKAGKHVVVVYDDLTNHAKVHRELSLLAEVSPGRDSYPGDMFYAHSSLLERAGKLVGNAGTLTALPVVLTPDDDITAYLPTSIMSITDGQIIFDLQSFRKGIRPAVNVGLSVSRIGGRVQSTQWKELSGVLFRKLADYRQAAEFAQFGSELAPQAQADLALGKAIYEVFRQPSNELYDIRMQYLLLATVMAGAGQISFNIAQLKRDVHTRATTIHSDAEAEQLVKELVAATTVKV
jgi:F-type H+-transporting ATPase subunit alpha